MASSPEAAARALAALPKLRGPIVRPNGAEIREQRASGWSPLQDGFHLHPEADQRRLDASPGFELCPHVADRPCIPVDVLGAQARSVGLRGAGVPEQFVEVSALGVLFALEDGSVFLGRDGALGFEHRLGPLQARDDGLVLIA